jgi:DNA-binding winged helix-turn-helix (wHTH) protein/Tfp pilus assembly protein PilF
MEQSGIRSQRVEFGSFELNLQTGELRNNGERIRLQEQPFKLLTTLLEHPGQVITREELRTKLWPADTFVDFDHSLNKAINKLREALGDSAEDPRFIETLPKRGYRFLAPTNEHISSKRGTSIDSIAVFPLTTSLPDPDLEYLSVGIPGSIIHSLSHISGLRVIAWNTLLHRKDWEEDPLAIGRSVGAKVILVGRIWQRGPKLRLHVDLLDTTNGEVLWGEQYDRDKTELFAIHDDIAREVSSRLRVKLTGKEATRLIKRHTENVEAYQLYVRARRWCERRSAEGFKRASEYLNRAIELDPKFALAYAELAQVISVPCYIGAGDPNIAYPKARATALRALEIDADLPEAHEIVATVFKNYDWNWDASEEKYRLAIALNPNYAVARNHYSYFLAEQGRFEEAIYEATEAVSRDPVSPLLNAGLAFVLLNSRKLDRAIELALTALEVDANMVLSYWTLGAAYEQKGRFEQAIDIYRRSIDRGSPIAVTTSFLIHAYIGSGQVDQARLCLRQIDDLSKTQYVPQLIFVIARAGLGEIDLALDTLEQSCALRETNLVQIKHWHHFDALRNHPRFHAVERRVGLRTKT